MKKPNLPAAGIDPYIEANRGFLTASKLKLFMKDPYMYWVKYELELDVGDKVETYFQLGTAFDDFVSYGELEFWRRYEILEPRKKRTEGAQKLQFTNSDGAVLLNMMKEARRQTLFDLSGEYNPQVEIKCEYEGIKLKGTLDRENEKMIRDTKTMSPPGKMAFSKMCCLSCVDFDYLFSMGFYRVLRYIHSGQRKKCICDFFGKGDPVKYLAVEIPEEVLNEQEARIMEALAFFKQCKDKDEWPQRKNTFTDDHLKAPYYPVNPSAIQTEFYQFQPDNFYHSQE
jgi:hypothetical protein